MFWVKKKPFLYKLKEFLLNNNTRVIAVLKVFMKMESEVFPHVMLFLDVISQTDFEFKKKECSWKNQNIPFDESSPTFRVSALSFQSISFDVVSDQQLKNKNVVSNQQLKTKNIMSVQQLIRKCCVYSVAQK